MTQLTLFDSPTATAVADAPKRSQSRANTPSHGARRSPNDSSSCRPTRNTQQTVRRFSDGPPSIAAKQQPSEVTPSVGNDDNRPLSENAKPKNSESPDGVQRMGDLARLVLMRYELVAKRRAMMAEKRRQKSGLA